jgi:hypothetical protein
MFSARLIRKASPRLGLWSGREAGYDLLGTVCPSILESPLVEVNEESDFFTPWRLLFFLNTKVFFTLCDTLTRWCTQMHEATRYATLRRFDARSREVSAPPS